MSQNQRSTKSVSDALKDLGALFEQRNKEYGNDYLNFGDVMMTLFPNGLLLRTAKDFSRFAILTFMLAKTTRYTKNFHNGGHKDSLDDISVYSQMLQQLDGMGG